ncbi:MAG: tocopherol cyclase family protein [Myxococcota bacterium]|nr:tocopherol cyclase family protein [Myxococcota bacterium]
MSARVSRAAFPGLGRLDGFQGRQGPDSSPAPWFEWWYYKGVVPATGDAFYLAYGVVNPGDEQRQWPASQAFVTFGWPRRGIFVTRPLPPAEFAASRTTTAVRIDGCQATPERLQGRLQAGGHAVSWDLSIENHWSFHATSWVPLFPGISNIHWHPGGADLSLTGTVVADGGELRLAGAPGYHDHNWGRFFPRWWLWIACNAFAGHPGTALVVGGGLPALFCRFEGEPVVCLGVRHAGEVHALRTIHLHRTRLEAVPGGWRVEATGPTRRISLLATAAPGSYFPIDLPKPTGGLFCNRETLTGHVALTLEERTRLGRWRTRLQATSELAGIELGTDPDRPLPELLTSWGALGPAASGGAG